jgi:hypothetical protein
MRGARTSFATTLAYIESALHKVAMRANHVGSFSSSRTAP